MKNKLNVFCILLAISTGITAQVPNFSFENWTSVGAYEVPDQWGTLNHTTDPLGNYTVTKGTPGNPGNYFLQVTSRLMDTTIVPGIAVSGSLDSITMQPQSGFAFAQRPQYLTGNWQYMSFSGSPGSISVQLTRWDSVNAFRETVAFTSVSLPGMVMSWTFFSLPLNYLTGDNPDTCIIVLEASGPNPDDNDYIWVDNLNFSGTVIGINDPAVASGSLAVNPNPANASATISIRSVLTSAAHVELQDQCGHKLKDIFSGTLSEGENNFEINTAEFPPGFYLVKVYDENGVRTSTLVITH